MSEPQRYDVFISYSAEDRAWVSQFTEGLRKSGLTGFFDLADVLPGDRWEKQMEQALRESKTLVVIVSPNSVQNSWMFFEVGAAIADRKRIIPVWTQDMSALDIPELLARYQSIRESTPAEAGRRVAEVVARTQSKNPPEPSLLPSDSPCPAPRHATAGT
jgi:hypothetical protein